MATYAYTQHHIKQLSQPSEFRQAKTKQDWARRILVGI